MEETVDSYTGMERMVGRGGCQADGVPVEPKACRPEGRCSSILRSPARQVWLDHRCDDVHMRWMELCELKSTQTLLTILANSESTS